jgi:hypothetical protein
MKRNFFLGHGDADASMYKMNKDTMNEHKK